MAGNDYRRDKAVLHCVVERWLLEAVKEKAKGQGRSLTGFVVELLEVAVDGDFGHRSDDHGLSASQGGAVGSHGGGDRGSDSQPSAVGRVDWDGLLAAGRAAKTPSRFLDPIEEIA